MGSFVGFTAKSCTICHPKCTICHLAIFKESNQKEQFNGHIVELFFSHKDILFYSSGFLMIKKDNKNLTKTKPSIAPIIASII